MGDFSFDNLRVRDGVKGAVLAASSLIVVPCVLYFAIREMSAASLTPHDSQALSAFILYAIILGAAVTVTIYLYGCYPKGSRSRLLFGMSSGALIVAYSFITLVMSGLSPVLSDIGIRLDTKYVALMVAYASSPLMFGAASEFVASRRSWLESAVSVQKRKVSVP